MILVVVDLRGLVGCDCELVIRCRFEEVVAAVINDCQLVILRFVVLWSQGCYWGYCLVFFAGCGCKMDVLW